MTNRERLRNMSNTELAAQLADWVECSSYCPGYSRCDDCSIYQCREKLKEWLDEEENE